jgi:hypothetical protein
VSPTEKFNQDAKDVVKFIKKGIHFQQTESGLTQGSERWASGFESWDIN